MNKYANVLIVVAALYVGSMSSAAAADLGYAPAGDQCAAAAATSDLVLTANMSELKSEVVRLMDEAIAVADSSEWINSARPAFVWASEAKVACGKAYGYLKTSYRDEDTLNKCECYYSRMIGYMN